MEWPWDLTMDRTLTSNKLFWHHCWRLNGFYNARYGHLIIVCHCLMSNCWLCTCSQQPTFLLTKQGKALRIGWERFWEHIPGQCSTTCLVGYALKLACYAWTVVNYLCQTLVVSIYYFARHTGGSWLVKFTHCKPGLFDMVLKNLGFLKKPKKSEFRFFRFKKNKNLMSDLSF